MKNVLLLLMFFFFCIVSNAQSSFQKTFGGNVTDILRCIKQTRDSGYVAVGQSNSYIAGNYMESLILKTNSLANSDWKITVGGSQWEIAHSVFQTIDGDFIMVGETYSFGAGMNDMLITFVEATGWNTNSVAVGGTMNDVARCVLQTADGHYLIAAETNSFGAGNYDILLFKIDYSLNTILWAKTYGGIGYDGGGDLNSYSSNLSLEQTSDGGFIISGTRSTTAILIKTDSDGNLQWTKMYESDWTSTHAASSVKQTTDGGYIFTGTTPTQSGTPHACVVKTNSSGNVQWSKVLSVNTPNYGLSVELADDGGFLISGDTSDYYTSAPYYSSAFLIKTDSSGVVQWSKTYGFPQLVKRAPSMAKTFDGGCIIGATYDFNEVTYNYDFYFIKTDSLGYSGCHEADVSFSLVDIVTHVIIPSDIVVGNPTLTITVPDSNDISVFLVSAGQTSLCFIDAENELESEEKNIALFPNPATNQLVIKNIHFTAREIKIYDVMGRCVFSQQPETNSQKQVIDVSNLDNGIYFVKVNTGNIAQAAKFVKD